ncbi:amino acid adenylation domain-containing protein [Gordonia sp. ABSL1-1]|uniref:amino acid adenylation domain-containing protein n=1 Tax=Gordonia sp. ABSL1-1 TaxID=3053923 RepID=UPI00257415A3|nr:amino acid adenylation domain-containing protein [Gordonia sp. ABSL1-1]MDL9935872.1 amino acid adenylation domain-containing protein [Gordonia sp. ABSL1-1]
MTIRASRAQHGLWVAQALLGPLPVFTVGELFDFGSDDTPDPVRLHAATAATITEADGFWSRFRQAPDGGLEHGSLEVVLDAPPPVELTDLGADPGAIDTYAAAATTVTIDPATGPCARIGILTAGHRVALLIVAHHLVTDAYGLRLLVRRIAQRYADPTDPRELASVRSLRVDDDLPAPRSRDFWLTELAGLDGSVTLAQQPRDHRIATSIRTIRIVLPGLGDAPRDVARLAAAVAAFCCRWADTDEVALGFPMMNRLGSPTAKVPCTAVNVIPLRIGVATHHTLDDIAEQTRTRLRELTPHARYRGEDLLADLRRRGIDGVIGPTLNIKPLGDAIAFADTEVQARSLARGPVVDLSITASPITASTPGDTTDSSAGRGDLELIIDADASLYSTGRLTYLVDALADFLREALHTARPIGAIGLRRQHDFDERARLSAADTDVACPVDSVALIDRIAAQDPDACAVVFGDERVDYRTLLGQVTDLADRLGPLGADDLVAVALPRGVDLIVALLAVWRSGAAFVPVDPQFPAARIAHILDDARPVVVIEPDRHAPGSTVVRRLRPSTPTPNRPDSVARTPAYVIYTSGSTGRPKGVVIEHHAVQNFAGAMIDILEYGPGRPVLAVTTISFDIAVLETLVPLAAGATVVLAADDDVHDPTRLLELIDRHRVAIVQATPSLWTMFLSATADTASADGARRARILAGVDALAGGEAWPPGLAAELTSTTRSVRNMYGPTETTIWSTTAAMRSDDPVTIGAPIANTGVRVLDQTLAPVEPGQVGELYLSGAGLARGYWDRSGLTSSRFLPDPFGAPGTRMYRTGDLVRVGDDGALRCLGRSDHQVKIRGFRIELDEIERALAADPAVASAAAAAVDGRIVAYVTAATDLRERPPTPIDLHARLATQLPDYMLPAAIMVLPALPLTPNGKLDRAALPTPDFAARAGRSRPPAGAAEHAVADAIADVLALPMVGADDDFFACGGDSISAVRVVTRLARVGWQVTALQLFDHRTPAALAMVATPIDRPAINSSGNPGPTAATGTTTMFTADLAADEVDELLKENLL